MNLMAELALRVLNFYGDIVTTAAAHKLLGDGVRCLSESCAQLRQTPFCGHLAPGFPATAAPDQRAAVCSPVQGNWRWPVFLPFYAGA